MMNAEAVTFGGSGLDRADALRGDAVAVSALYRAAGARTMLMWQGKPLLDLAAGAVAWLRAGHPVLTGLEPPLFLGRDEGGAGLFAHELADWQPEEATPEPDGFFDLTRQCHPDLPQTLQFVELRNVMADLSARDAETAATARALFGWHRGHGFCARCGARSGLCHAGWQRSCPACGAIHFPRTDPVVIMLITRGNRVLLGRSHGWPEGMYSLLAGFVEPGETIEAAVRREVQEEAGIAVGAVGYLASQPWPYPASLMLGCRGDALSEDIEVDPKELEDARWITREELAEVFAGNRRDVLPARKGSIAQFILSNWLADSLD
ncbi:NAD(+) diphosphatase [Brevirhabdus sp.]|uniref:NAD(+) diphosphatase n=1 Tax=Brevirhabdus sp. TaxID=2004514 RepID=UPI00405A16BC